ncbi:hypothetical protein [Arenicella xantha]|uniref:Uncharacterized protein n=1 Tax=Arenicella xantha TaxID=644221 RepID=A0A395JQ90_9GAMM|nr:hypothetical protein [Arenicella xantha]RBP52785.1 hypothetical protein DFR28_101169 [Arenicella xantha]
MDKQSNTEQQASDAALPESIIQSMVTVFQDVSDYALSRLSLAAIEAKLAMVSIVLMFAMALFVLMLLAGSWALACYLLASWLIDSSLASHAQAIGAVIGVNVVGLLISISVIIRLADGLTFKHTLNFQPSTRTNAQEGN